MTASLSIENELSCWCGSVGLVPAPHKDYLICPTCNTAQLRRLAEMRKTGEAIDFNQLYSAEYWDAHQKDLGLPSFLERARLDLADRCVYWLDYLLKYKLPPARVLEIGSAHGAFVKLMNSAGFDAMGMEMNATTIQQARDWFGVNTIQGPLEEVGDDLGHFDVIAMFDVMEHLTDPTGTLSQIVKRVKPGGVLMLQTPMHTKDRDANWMHFLPPEHTFIFSEKSMRQILERAGLSFIDFHPAIFPWDMFVFASASPMTLNSKQTMSANLELTPDRRLVRAMLDLRAEVQRNVQIIKDKDELSSINPFNRYGVLRVGRYFLSYCKQALKKMFSSAVGS